jgi:hypothetical protein
MEKNRIKIILNILMRKSFESYRSEEIQWDWENDRGVLLSADCI